MILCEVEVAMNKSKIDHYMILGYRIVKEHVRLGCQLPFK